MENTNYYFDVQQEHFEGAFADGPRSLGPCIRASDHILSKLSLATDALEGAGFTLRQAEWGSTTAASPLGAGVSQLYAMQWGFETAPGVPWTKPLSSLTGQVTQPTSSCHPMRAHRTPAPAPIHRVWEFPGCRLI